MLKDLVRLGLIWGLFVLTWVMAGSFCDGEETTPHLNGTLVQIGGPKDANGVPVVVVEDFRDLPHDYAKRLPLELYYWWAKAHNQRQAARTPATTHGVLQIQEDYSIMGTAPPTPTWNGRSRGGRFNANSSRTTTQRYFPQQTGSGPAMIYNPYFR
jgi:hypothetical protein